MTKCSYFLLLKEMGGICLGDQRVIIPLPVVETGLAHFAILGWDGRAQVPAVQDVDLHFLDELAVPECQ